jgi:hypothetical protein
MPKFAAFCNVAGDVSRRKPGVTGPEGRRCFKNFKAEL